ncbi:MAG: hypothetical protein U1E76_11185 [Planctomycetota bacterium]
MRGWGAVVADFDLDARSPTSSSQWLHQSGARRLGAPRLLPQPQPFLGERRGERPWFPARQSGAGRFFAQLLTARAWQPATLDGDDLDW